MDERKKIKILSSGPIECCGYIWGPVLTPYMELTSKIFKMISSGVHVVEVLEDGTEVKLTVENLKKDNTVTTEPAEETEVETEVAVESPVIEDPFVDTMDASEEVKVEESETNDVVVEVVEDEKSEETAETKTIVTDEVNNRNNNRNKHRR